MSAASMIVVRRAERIGGYREVNGGDALVLDQVAPAANRFVAPLITSASSVAGLVAAGISTMVAPSLAVPLLASGMLGGVGLSALADWMIARRGVTKARVIVSNGLLRVVRPGEGGEPAVSLPIHEVCRIEIVPREMSLAIWLLVAITNESAEHPLLETGDRVAALRVRSLLVERLARDGGWVGSPTIASPCPSCRKRIVALAASLPTAVACAYCGAEGTLMLAA
jgi:hypothetical protein